MARKTTKKKAAPKKKKKDPGPTKSAAQLFAEQFVAQNRVLSRRGKYVANIEHTFTYHNAFDLRRPSGIIGLDLACAGGLPAGGMSQIDGPESTGKNMLLNMYMRECQRLYGHETGIAHVSIEYPYDKDYGRAMGVDVALDPYDVAVEQRYREEQGLPPMTKEEIARAQDQVGAFLLLSGDTEKMLDQVLEIVRSNTFQLVCIDSWDATLNRDQQAKSLTDDAKMAGNSLMESQFMRKLHAALNSKDSDGRMNETTIIGIRQVRAIMERTGYGPSTESKGSHAMKHGKLLNVTLRRGKYIRTGGREQGAKGAKIGKIVGWTVTKGKAGCHEGPTGTFDYYYDPPMVDAQDGLVDAAIELGVIVKGGSYYAVGDKKIQGRDQLKGYIATTDGLADQLRDQILKAAKLKIRYR